MIKQKKNLMKIIKIQKEIAKKIMIHVLSIMKMKN